ncbi:hypothetical protein PENTCL1PPCAC_13358, partial [Pristionchus entomophagus]
MSIQREFVYIKTPILFLKIKYNDEPSTFKNFSCFGDFCFVTYNDIRLPGFPLMNTRGCISIVDDSLAERTIENGIYQYMQLEFYICSHNHCNNDTVQDYKVKALSNQIVETTTKPSNHLSSIYTLTLLFL